MTPDSSDHPADADDDEITQSVATRWSYTNDLLAAVVMLSFVGLVGAVGYAAATGRITAQIDFALVIQAYVAVVLLAAVWLFGTKAVDAYRQLRK